MIGFSLSDLIETISIGKGFNLLGKKIKNDLNIKFISKIWFFENSNSAEAVSKIGYVNKSPRGT